VTIDRQTARHVRDEIECANCRHGLVKFAANGVTHKFLRKYNDNLKEKIRRKQSDSNPKATKIKLIITDRIPMISISFDAR
jgi:hypothetical protein